METTNSKDILNWIDVGKVSAERDDLLSKYYFDSGLLQRVIISPSYSLVLGRKGAGKTAVFKYLSENKDQVIGPRNILIPLSFEDYNWRVHGLLKNPDAAESLAYRHSWRFIILVEAIKGCVKMYTKNNIRTPSPIEAANKLLEKLFDKPIPSIYDIMGKKLLSLSKLKMPKVGLDLEGTSLDSFELTGGEVSFEDVEKSSSIQSLLTQNLVGVMGLLESALRQSLPLPQKLFLAFDRVDEAWDDVSFDSSKKVIAGLVGAAESFSLQFRDSIRVLVFLREDIFEVLSLNDLNKLREDSGALLKWDKAALQKLLLCRINHFASESKEAVVTDVDALYDRQEMRQGTSPSNYIIKRTMMRPRDLICFYRKLIDVMKDERSDPFATMPPRFEKLQVKSIYDAEPAYSEWLKKELIDEWSVQRPEIKDFLSAIQNNGSTNFTEIEFNTALNEVNIKLGSASAQSHLSFLYDNSVIGFRSGESSIWKYRCFYPSQGFVPSAVYRVHDGLVRALNLKEPRSAKE